MKRILILLALASCELISLDDEGIRVNIEPKQFSTHQLRSAEVVRAGTENANNSKAVQGGEALSSLDANAKDFIENFKKQDLYVSSMSQDQSNRAVIDGNTGDITLNSADVSAFQGNLKFIKALNGTKAVYRIDSGSNNGKYVLLKYDPIGGTDTITIVESSSMESDDSQFSDSTQTSNGNGALYKITRVA